MPHLVSRSAGRSPAASTRTPFQSAAPETGFFRHQDAEDRLRFQRVHQPHETRAVDKLGATDAVVHKDAGFINGPALATSVRFRVLHVARNRLLLVGDAVLFRALSCVDSRISAANFASVTSPYAPGSSRSPGSSNPRARCQAPAAGSASPSRAPCRISDRQSSFRLPTSHSAAGGSFR
jgi:hypothetical protein